MCSVKTQKKIFAYCYLKHITFVYTCDLDKDQITCDLIHMGSLFIYLATAVIQ